MLYKITEIEEEILKEDNILNSTLKELKKYKGEKSYFNKEIGEEAIKFLNELVDTVTNISWGCSLFEYDLIFRALTDFSIEEPHRLVGEFKSEEEYKKISNKILNESIKVIEDLRIDFEDDDYF